MASFPSRSVALVDAVVWTQTAAGALSRLAQGERTALRNLFDQTVLRLETMARQARGLRNQQHAGIPGGSGGQMLQQHLRGLEALLAAGVCHRQVRATRSDGRLVSERCCPCVNMCGISSHTFSCHEPRRWWRT